MFEYPRNEHNRCVPTDAQIEAAPDWAKPVLALQARKKNESAPGLARHLCHAFLGVPEYVEGDEDWLAETIIGMLPKRIPNRARPAGQKATITQEQRAAVINMFEEMETITTDEGEQAYVAKYRYEDIEIALGLSKADVAMAVRNHLGKRAGGFTDPTGRFGTVPA